MDKIRSKHIKNGLFFVFVIVISTYIIFEFFIPEKTIDVFRYKPYIVVSASMEPDIMINDMIIVHKVTENNLSERDAITFNVYIPELGRKSEVTHYIGNIQTSEGTTIYKTQGATKDPGDYDQWKNKDNEVIEITYEDIEGRVVLVIPYIGYVAKILKDPISLVLLFINGFIIYLIVKGFKKPKKEIKISE